jgi:hypothetical protein
MIVLLLAVGLPSEGTAQIRTKELAGRWRYNEARSDRLRDKLPPDPYYGTMPQGRPTTPPAGQDSARGQGQGQGQVQGQGRPGARRPPGPGIVGETGIVQAIRQPPEELLIELTDSTVTFTDDRGQTKTLATDGEKLTEDIGGIRMERKVRWDDGDLVLEDKVKNGGTLRTTFRYDRVLKRMTVLAVYSGPRYPTVVEIRRVYDRILEEAPVPPQDPKLDRSTWGSSRS